MNFLVGLVCIILGILILASPDAFLRMEDHFRVKGERTYSDAAIFFMRLRGVIAIILGIVFMFVQF
ncbi:MAG: hypothetical protein CVV61_05750 [Tenericutes bacterium HGW-Tenericutes-6]|jgi:uncharacterized membrane protein HdeD (DUF308 family)|nr:MAG: hypothetical protein CVV62_00705 [Tenericutes bacterium HGW-Tenericutes-7]PKK93219.1 MAG: hypothetical protein CVV61_05750 [Tenericutes bacterium HGW-Tenericutes-6]